MSTTLEHSVTKPVETPVLQPLGNGYHRFDFQALGTPCCVEIRAPSHRTAMEFRDKACRWVCDFEARYSRFRPDSLLSEINRQAGLSWAATDPELDALFQLCDWFYWNTQAIFDPTSLPLSRLWEHADGQPSAPSPDEVRQALGLVGWQKVQRAPGRVFLPWEGMALDLGGIGKEYAVDRVFELAVKFGFPSILVNFGGDLRLKGEAPTGGLWSVGLEHPGDPGRCWCGLALTDRAVATSGNYLRTFNAGGHTYSHLIDPRNGYPLPGGRHAASVIAESCTEAGIMASAAVVLGPTAGVLALGRARHVEGAIWLDDQLYETPSLHRYVS